MTFAPQPDWHWPHFAHTLCGEMTDRERLGLPDRYVPGRLDDALQQALAELRTADSGTMLEVLASEASTLASRLACGNLLALTGDPRIRVDEPDMRDVPGGEVNIGLAPGDVSVVLERFDGLGLSRSWIEKECPQHLVTLAPFRMARFPVTNIEFRAFLLDTGHPEIPDSWSSRRFPIERANHPVYTISAASADAYAHWLAQRTGRAFRLPSEAEWEWAASGPQHLEFPWGNDFDADRANTAETGLFTTSPVGTFPGGDSPFGLADMSGNVEEYVATPYAPYPGGTFIVDHLVQIHGSYRVARGGSFARFRDLARTRRRHGHNPKSATYAMGVRLAETI